VFCLQKEAVNHSRYRPLSSHAPFFANKFPRGPLGQILLLRASVLVDVNGGVLLSRGLKSGTMRG